MTEPGDVIQHKGKLWVSIGIFLSVVAGVVAIAVSGANIYWEMKAGQGAILSRMDAGEVALAANQKAVEENSDAIVSLTNVMAGMQVNLASALNDRWTATDTKFWGLEMSRFWSDFQRHNPTLVVPGWPEPKRVTDDGEK